MITDHRAQDGSRVPAPPAPWTLHLGGVGLALFTILNLVVFVMVFINPEARSVVPIAPESTPDISTE